MGPSTPLLDRDAAATVFHRAAGPVSAAAFLGDALAFAAALPGAGDVVNLCRDRYAFAVAFAAAVLRGHTSLLNVELAALPGLAAANPGLVIASDEAMPLCPVPVAVVRTGVGQAGVGQAGHSVPEVDPGLLAALVFTSGSTGAPVAHGKRWGALVARSRAAAAAFGIGGGSVVGMVPPQHMYGFETTVLLPLHAPVASWCGPAFFPGDVAAALAACAAPCVLVTTPLQMRALLQAGLGAGAMAAAISATAPLDPALAAEAEAAWGAPVLEIFGATECGSVAMRRTVAGPDWAPYPGVAVEIAEGAATVLAAGAEPVPLADVLESAGSGFRLLGRRTDLVKLGGRRASLSGLNRVLTGLDGVADGAFVLPDAVERGTPRLIAVVVAPGRTTPAILAELRRLLDPTFVPRRVIQVDAMPRNALGKLPRQALLQLVAAAG